MADPSVVNAGAASAFRTSPSGFYSSHEQLNRMPAGLVAHMCMEVMDASRHKDGNVSPSQYIENGLSPPVVVSVLSALTFIYRVFIRQQVTVAQANYLLMKETEFNEEKRNIIVNIWNKNSKVKKIVDFTIRAQDCVIIISSLPPPCVKY